MKFVFHALRNDLNVDFIYDHTFKMGTQFLPQWIPLKSKGWVGQKWGNPEVLGEGTVTVIWL